VERITKVKVPSPPVEVEMEVPATSYLGRACMYLLPQIIHPWKLLPKILNRSHRLKQKTSKTEFQSEGGYHRETLERYSKGFDPNPSLSCILASDTSLLFLLNT
jgi:hypothetical protein